MKTALEAIRARRSIREFDPQPVDAATIQQLVEAAGRAPSGKNSQPWKLFLVQGAALEALRADMLAAFDAEQPGKPDYRYGPEKPPVIWLDRAREVGYGIFAHKGIERDDKVKRRAHDRENFRFFGAPHVFVLALPRQAAAFGAFLDCGFMLENLMVGLTSLGYGSCPQASVLGYSDVLRKHLPGSEDLMFLCGLPFGRPLAGSHVNEFQPPRAPLDQWFTVVG